MLIIKIFPKEFKETNVTLRGNLDRNISYFLELAEKFANIRN